jgi:hypothetical protein
MTGNCRVFAFGWRGLILIGSVHSWRTMAFVGIPLVTDRWPAIQRKQTYDLLTDFGLNILGSAQKRHHN